MTTVVLQLDPASLGLWFGLGATGDPAVDQVVLDATNAALLGDVDALATAVAAAPSEAVARRAAAVASTMWHECRHFADIALTSFGAFKIRRYLSLYVNAPRLISELRAPDGTVHCPVTDHLDPVTRMVHGLREPSPDVQNLLRDVVSRAAMHTDDQLVVPSAYGEISLGGKAQLEAIAYMTQSASIGAAVGLDRGFDAVMDVPDHDTVKTNYAWIVALEALGLVQGLKLQQDRVLVTGEPLLPLLFGALCTRHWGQPRTRADDVGPGFPAERLYGLGRRLGPEWKREWPSWSQAWDQVNEASESLWGRSAIDELDEDVRRFGDYVEQLAEVFGADQPPVRWARDLQQLRVDLLALLRETPQVLLDVAQAATLTGLLDVPIIMAVPGGQDYPLPDGYGQLSAYAPPGEPPGSGWWWAATRRFDGSSDGLGFRDYDAWAAVTSDYAPVAKLLMQGRRHRVMLGPELVAAEQRLSAAGIQLTMAPAFVAPDEPPDPGVFWHFHPSDVAVCDRCRAQIPRPGGYLVSAWAFRVATALGRLAIDEMGGGDTGYRRFIRDWSGWLLCDSCRDDLLPLVPAQHRSLLTKGVPA